MNLLGRNGKHCLIAGCIDDYSSICALYCKAEISIICRFNAQHFDNSLIRSDFLRACCKEES